MNAIKMSTEKAVRKQNQTNKRRNVSYSRYGYFFIAPFFITYGIFQLYPLLYTMYLSLHKYMVTTTNKVIGPDFIGLSNFKEIMADSIMLGAFRNTLIMWVINFIPQIMLALLLAAWFTDTRLKVKGQGFYKVLIFMPNIITAASISVLFYSLFAFPQGPVNTILASAGILDASYFQPGMAAVVAIDFLNKGWETRLIIVFINFWMWYGNTMIVLIAGILGISPSLFESAQIDGATSGQIFRKITLPMIRPIMLYTLVTSMIGGMQMYDIPAMMLKQGSPAKSMIQTVTMYIFEMAFTGTKDYGRASAVSVILFLLTAIMSSFLFYFLRDKDAIAERKNKRKEKAVLKEAVS